MTPREPENPLFRGLARSHRAVLRAWGAHFGLRAAAAATSAIAIAVVLGMFLALGEIGTWIRLALIIGFWIFAIAVALARYRRSALSFDSYLQRVEERFPEVRSWLRNALDLTSHPSAHTSPELSRAVTDETARRIDSVPLQSLVPRIRPRLPLLAVAASAAAIVGLAFVFPQRVDRSWSTLWNPALAAPPVRLEVEPGSVRITPGAALAVRARVWGTSHRPDLLREHEPGLSATAEGVDEHGARLWRFDLTQLTRQQDYRVRVAGVESPRYTIALAGEPLPLSFDVEYRAPAYARLPVQRGAATRGDLSALRGTHARIEVTFDRDLTALRAALPGGSSAAWTPITARRWRGEITLDREGDYQLEARAQSGAARYQYKITPLPDAPPLIAVHTPGGDLDLPAGQQVPLEIEGQDDLGLSELTLQFHKDPAAPWTELPLARFNDRPRESTVRSHWDASRLALLPGETATFRFVLFDDNAVSGRGRAVSPTYELRFPSLADLYQNMDQKQGNAQTALEKVADQARELQKSLEKLAREPVRGSQQNGSSFERNQELKSAMDRQQQLAGKIDDAAQQLKESLEQAAERQAFNEQLTQKLHEVSELMQQIQSKEFREAVRRMQEALENVDQRTLDQQLPEMKNQHQEMIERLQRTVELLKQLRQEERLDALAKRAEELKNNQDALNQQRESQQRKESAAGRNRDALEAERRALAEQQARAASETEQLAKDAKDLAQEMKDAEAKAALDSAAAQLDPQASEEQREAAQSGKSGEHAQSQSMGKKASSSLEQAAQQLASATKKMQQQREGVDLAAVRRAAMDLNSLQRETEGNLGSSGPMNERADRQTDISEGVSRVADSLYTLAKHTPFISPKLGEALGRAINNLSQSGREMGNGNRQHGEELGRGGSSALNEAVLELRMSEASMCKSTGPSPGNKPGENPQRLGDVGQQQSQLNQETRSLAERLSQQTRLSTGDRDQLQRMAGEQRRLREQLEQIQKDDQTRHELLGKLDQTRREMKEVEDQLSSGSTGGELEEKQQHILSRLLDAQRSVNRRDFDPQRESRPGEDVVRASAPEIPQDLLRESDRLRLDLLKAEADRYPAQYRAFVEAYLRRLNGARR